MLLCGRKASQAEEAMMLTSEEKQAWCQTARKSTTVEAGERKNDYRVCWQERRPLWALVKSLGFK